MFSELTRFQVVLIFVLLYAIPGGVLAGQRGADPYVRDGHQERREGDGGAQQGLQQHSARRHPRQRELTLPPFFFTKNDSSFDD